MRLPTRALANFCMLGAIALGAGCGGGGDTPSTPASIAIGLASTAGSVAPGSSTTVGITLTRTNFSGDITLGVSGAPAGVTTTLSTASLPNGTNSATLTVSASANAAAGASSITVVASGSGVDSKSVTYALTVSPAAAYTMTLASTSATLVQSASSTVNVALARTNFTGAVTLAASGVPSGASVTFSPNPAAADASVMTVNAGTAAVGTYTVTVTGSASGMTDRTATFVLTVTAAPVATTVVYSFCSNPPLWFGYQNGTSGAWTTVAPGANNTYTFSVNGPSGVAFVQARDGNAAANGYATAILYGGVADLQGNGGGSCLTGAKTINGTVAGLGTGEQAEVNLASSYTYAFTNGAYSLSGVPNGAYDLMSSLLGTSDLASKVIIRRAQNPADNATLPVIDFGAAEAIATTPMILTFTGLAATQPDVFSQLESATGTTTTLASVTASGGTVASVGVPLANLASSDLQSAFAFVDEGAFARGAFAYFRAPDNRTIAIGPSVNTPVASTVTTTPYVRTQLAVASQPAYSGIVAAEFQQGGSVSAPSDRAIEIVMTPAYLGSTPTTWTLTIPDFSAATGFSASYALAPGVTTAYAYYGYGFDYLTGTIADGTTFQFGGYQSTMVPSAAGGLTPRATLSASPTTQKLVARLRTLQRALPSRRQRLTTGR